MQKNILILFLFLLIPKISFAMLINEIMFDAPGTDTGHEWIEVYNSTQNEIDLLNWRFFENSVAHTLDLIRGENKIPVGGYVIIASDSNLFMADYPDFSGILFDSVFSLVNTGELLALVNSSGEKVNEITYSGDIGAKGDGNTLQLVDGVFISALATPGAQNAQEPLIENEDISNDSATSSVSAHSSQESISKTKENPELSISIGRERLGSVNTSLKFEAERFDQKNAGTTRYFWNMGDGSTKKGKEVSHFYKHEGIYNVVVNAFSAGKRGVARAVVHIKKPKIKLEIKEDGLFISNLDFVELNIGDWELKSLNDSEINIDFVFPEDTIISAKNSLIFDKEIFIEDSEIWQKIDSLNLFFPNEKIAATTTEKLL